MIDQVFQLESFPGTLGEVAAKINLHPSHAAALSFPHANRVRSNHDEIPSMALDVRQRIAERYARHFGRFGYSV